MYVASVTGMNVGVSAIFLFKLSNAFASAKFIIGSTGAIGGGTEKIGGGTEKI